jgi:hypothetical protein
VSQLIGAAQLTWMRDVQALIRPDSGTIDGVGGYDDTEANGLRVGTSTLRVRPMDLSGRGEYVTGGQVTALARWDITLDDDAVVRPQDRIKTGDRVYEVTRINNDETWLTAVRVEAITYNEETNRG